MIRRPPRSTLSSSSAASDVYKRQGIKAEYMGIKNIKKMGNIIKMILDWFNGITKCRILMVGLDAAGKTTMLYKLKLGEIVTTIPTIGFNVETITYKNFELLVWDVGGQDKLRPLWKHYYANTTGLIYVIDSTDQRIDEAIEKLKEVITAKDMLQVPVLIFANKQDLSNVLSASEILQKVEPIMGDRQFFIQPSCCLTGDGLYEGLDWFSNVFKSRKSSVE
eukprot:TRINITY_DN1850_c0_g1_i3.p2 TRINITY_DN1850_c0_g1~~TRINITY_DN1850_c0_g1_i3.p2  ORF type:complete len:221 (+),score=41.93 TRINITY_DN1850_c0_g1_i3:102-764(+)